DLVLRDLAVDRAHLLIANAAIAAGVKLVQADLAALRRRGGERLDGDGNQTELEKALPARTSSHRSRSGNAHCDLRETVRIGNRGIPEIAAVGSAFRWGNSKIVQQAGTRINEFLTRGRRFRQRREASGGKVVFFLI